MDRPLHQISDSSLSMSLTVALVEIQEYQLWVSVFLRPICFLRSKFKRSMIHDKIHEFTGQKEAYRLVS